MTTHTTKETETDNPVTTEQQDREYLNWLKNTHSPHAEAHERHIASLSSKLGSDEEESDDKPDTHSGHAGGFSKKK